MHISQLYRIKTWIRPTNLAWTITSLTNIAALIIKPINKSASTTDSTTDILKTWFVCVQAWDTSIKHWAKIAYSK